MPFVRNSAQCVAMCLLLCCINQFSFSQTNSFNFTTFTNKNGLSSNVTNAIIQDSYGYMWFATDDGLNRFDGAHFTVYRNNPRDSLSIGSNVITALYKDHKGQLWIGTAESLSLFDPRSNTFKNYWFPKNSSIRGLYGDRNGKIWVGGYGGLFILNPDNGELKHYDKADLGKGSNVLQSNTVLCAFEDSRGRMWIGTNNGLHLYRKDRDDFQVFQHSIVDAASISSNIIRAIVEDASGNLWFASKDGGLSLLPAGKNEFKSFRSKSRDLNSLSCDNIFALALDRDQQLWVGTDEGISIVDTKSMQVTRVMGERASKNSLSQKSIRSIYIDNKGIYWVGTNYCGVSKYDKNMAFFNLCQSNPFDKSGLSSSVVTSFEEDDRGDLYIGTNGGGLNLYHTKSGLFSHPRLTVDESYKTLSIVSLERVKDEIWIGTYQNGLYVLNVKNGSFRNYSKARDDSGLSGNEVYCLKEDSKGNIWIGTNGNGVNVYNPVTGKFKKWSQADVKLAPHSLFYDGFIRCIEEDVNGQIWIGTIGGGIAKYDPSTGDYKILNRANSNLPVDKVQTIYQDASHRLWVGTHGGGLSYYNASKNTFESYSENDGLANSVVYKITGNGTAKLWLSTNKGISSFDAATKKFENYTAHNGLQKSSFAPGAGLMSSRGELYFGGNEGFNHFRPEELKVNLNTPELVFTDLKVSNASVTPGENSVISEHISIAQKINLNYKQNFSLDFVALNYTSPQENRYAYKLEGFDQHWNEVGSTHSAVYTNLDPGEYTFHIKAKSESDSWSTPIKSIRIYVKPPIWRTTYAYIFYALLFFAIIGYTRYRGIRRLKKSFALEQERIKYQQLIEEEKRERERQHEFDELKIKFLTNLSHEFRTPISLLVGPIEKMISCESDKEKLSQLGMVQRNSRRLLNLVNQLLDFKRLEEKESKLNVAEADVISCLRDAADSFTDVAKQKNIDYTFVTSVSSYTSSFDKDKIERIFFNLLSNAFKFTPMGGSIALSVECVEFEGINVVLKDTGIGMSEEDKGKVFERFYQGRVGMGILNQGSGIGLSITNEFVKLHGGQLTVESQSGMGSQFAVFLPLVQVTPVVSERTAANGALNQFIESSAYSVPVPDSEKICLLIVEDDDDFRSYTRDSLKNTYKVIEASNGTEGWQKALAAHPKIILSDINMPCMDGIELTKKIKSDKRTKHIPIILLTALTGDASQLKGLETGANDYLTKPFNIGVLNLKVRNLLNLNTHFEATYSKQWKVASPEPEVQNHDASLLQKVVTYIEKNLDNPDLSVEELSKHVYMSRGALYNKIISLTGETPVEFIRSIKLNKAAMLLERSDMKITEIAYAAGFSTSNYFARAFKAKFNISPTEYAQAKRAG